MSVFFYWYICFTNMEKRFFLTLRANINWTRLIISGFLIFNLYWHSLMKFYDNYLDSCADHEAIH